MADPKRNSNHQLWMLGAVMMLPLILFGGPVVGYLIGQYVLVDKFGWGEFCLPVSVGLGFVAAGMQTVKLIQRIRNYESHNKP